MFKTCPVSKRGSARNRKLKSETTSRVPRVPFNPSRIGRQQPDWISYRHRLDILQATLQRRRDHMVDDSERPAKPSNEAREVQHKVEQPHAHFENPAEVVIDPALSKDDKVRALEAMEQDAKQMSVASGEGMGGGERAGLDDVLSAKDALALPPFDPAVSAVIQTLRSKLPQVQDTDTHTLISSAIDTLEAACASIKPPANGV